MPDPRIAAFQQAWEQNPDPVFRNDLKKAFAEGIMQGNTQPIALGILRETSNAIGEDLTELFTKQPVIAPITPEESSRRTQEAIKEKTPWYRRAFSKALAVAEWEQENIAEPSAALVLDQLFNLYPGQQNFERNMDIVRRDIQRERVKENRDFTLLDHVKAARGAYNKTNLSWGLKGFSELIFDPLNLVGAGIPAKVGKAAPALKPLLFPARIIDEAPARVAGKMFQGAAQLKKLPVIESLAKPHWTSQVAEVRRQVDQSILDGFGPLVNSDNPADTANFFNNLTRFPEDAGPYSIRNIMNHLEAMRPYETHLAWLDDLKALTPADAVKEVSELVAAQEAKALKLGGERLSGELITESISARRQHKLESIFQRMALDEKHSKAIALGIDKHIFGWIENTYLRKIEPNFVRPWALMHLSFVGYFPGNILEDIGMTVGGMNTTVGFKMGDPEFNLMRAGLVGKGIPPDHLIGAEKRVRNVVSLETGQFDKGIKESTLTKMANNSVFYLIRKSGEIGWNIRRSAWNNKLMQEIDTAVTEIGVTPQQLDNLRIPIQAEFPGGLENMRDYVTGNVWAMVATGNPESIRQVKDLVSSTRVTQKTQAGLMTEFPNFTDEVRATFLRNTFADEGINAGNSVRVTDEMHTKLLNWHKFTPEGMKAGIGDLVNALGTHTMSGAPEAAGLLRMVQHAGDTISSLPREIRAHTAKVANKLKPGERDAVWQESLRLINEDLGKVRADYAEALVRSKPQIERFLTAATKTGVQSGKVSRSIDDIFESYTAISQNLDEAWESFRARTKAHFDTVAKGQRDEAFWLQYEEIGNEVWGAEKLQRDILANNARTGWNSLLDELPSNLSGKDREFMKAGLEAGLGDARQRRNDLQIELNDLENLLPGISDVLRPTHIQRIETVSEALRIAAQHEIDLGKRLEGLVKRKTSTKPSELRDYDKAVKALNVSITEATKNGFESLPRLQQQLAATIVERSEAFESFIPVFLRPEWDALQAQRTHLENLVEIGGRGAKARAGELRSTNAAIRRFTKRIENGEGIAELQRISGATDTVLSGVARSVLRASDGAIPETIEDMTEAIAQLADQGDEAAVAFVEAQESLAVRFGETPLSESGLNVPGDVTGRLAQEPGPLGQFFRDKPLRAVNKLEFNNFIQGNIQPAFVEKFGETPFMQAARIRGDELVVEITSGGWEEKALELGLEKVPGQGNFYRVPGEKAIEGEEIIQALPEGVPPIDVSDVPSTGGRVPLGTSEEELVQRAYTRVVETAKRPALTPLQLNTLREAALRDLFPDRALAGLVEDGFVTSPVKLKDGKWSVQLTDRGQEILTVSEDIPKVDMSDLLADLPEPVREFNTIVDQLWTEVDDVVQKAVDIAQTPPMPPGDAARVGKYIDDRADDLARDPDLQSRLKAARQTAAERTNTSYDDFFINYDNRSTLDFVMQRFMPFWMYQSRRWPRLIRLAAQRPILAKHYTMLMGDWDYGYTPTPYGFEFNPAKGAITNQLRRTVSRDFPELHSGYRGATEQGLDWIARGGGFFTPPLTGAIDLVQGEPGNIIPPPLSLLLHSMTATGAGLPDPLLDITFNARHLQFTVDNVLADMGHSAATIRNGVDNDDDEAAGIFYTARQEAAWRIIVNSQSSVSRYRPNSKREFILNSQEAVEEIIGVTKRDQELARDAGISIYEMFPVSGFQRRQLRESIPNYDAWVGASISLRPLDEQKRIRRIDAFWQEHSRQQEMFEADIKDISDRWESGDLSGVEAKRKLSEIKRTRSIMMESLRSQPEFVDVPVTLEERQEYAKQFNKPPQMASPVDELLERYYAVDPESPAFKDDIEGETNWSLYFDEREKVLNSAVPQVQAIARDSLARSDTPLERMLHVSAPWLREYYGIRTTFTEQAEAEEPGVTWAYREYRRLQNLSNITVDPEVKAAFRQDAIDVAAQAPIVQRIESGVRIWREDFRKSDSTMEAVFQMFLSSPGKPTIGETVRRGFRPSRPERPDRPRRIGREFR